jgi:nucleoid DNA-binding protein
MNRKDVAFEVADRLGEKQTTVRRFMDQIFDVIRESLSDNETVKIRGFGTFKPTVLTARPAKRLPTGAKVFVPERIVPKFVPSSEFDEL